jgi:hypothetical protein
VGADPHRLLPRPLRRLPHKSRSQIDRRHHPSNDAYALVSVEGRTIWHLTAMSQSLEAMDPQTFQASKRAVLELLADILGVEPADLMLAGAAA